MVVTAYLMAHNGWSRDRALEFVRQKRSIVNPNRAFMQLLLEWEEHLRIKPQAMSSLRHWKAA
jgi:protein-tyrosine phosphatase